MMIASAIDEALRDDRDRGTYRELERSRDDGHVPTRDFASNDYLGLTRCRRIREQLVAALETGCPLGSTGSRLLTGQTPYHERVENFLTRAFDVESALLFSSGYLANLGVMTALASLGACFFSDSANHASLIDGMRLAKNQRFIYRHNNVTHLEELLAASDGLRAIVSESVFSMDGDRAPLTDLVALGRRFDAVLVIDEAHATGVFGRRGLGCLEDVDTSDVALVSIHTGGKALGGQGAFVLTSRALRDLLVNRARSFIYTTGLAPLQALHLEYALTSIIADDTPRKRIASHVTLLRAESQIVPIVLGSNERVLRARTMLAAHGLDVRAIRAPTVAPGTERLRITLKSFHTSDDVQKLVHHVEHV
jgi:8-amino-7-oxononanoate synthase